MGKRISENCSKGYKNALINLDPNGVLHYDCSHFTICKSCLKPYGQIERPSDTNQKQLGKWYFQNCGCTDDKNGKNGKNDLGKIGSDFITVAEFCYCCSMELINGGYKFSPFYCNDCMKLVRGYNTISGKNSIPLGRHSFMNGIMLVSPFTKKEKEQYELQLEIFFKGIDIIKEWQIYCLFENLHDLGFDLKADVPVSVYDRLVIKLKNNKLTKFNDMVGYFNSQKIN